MTKVSLKLVEPAGWKPKHRAVAERAIALMETVLADNSSDGFLARVKKARYSAARFRKDDGTFVQLTPSKIAEVIRTGKERKTAPDDTINLQVRLRAYAVCNSDSCKMGYVLPPDPVITTNLNWINKQVAGSAGGMDPVSVGAHWIHEWMHVAGFRHKGGKVDRKDAPYKVGSLFTAAAKEVAQRRAETIGEDYSPTWGAAYEESIDLMIANDTNEYPSDVVPADEPED